MAKQPPTRPWPRLVSLHPAPSPIPPLQAQPSRPSEPSAAPFATPATRFAGVFGRTSSPSLSPSQKVPSPPSPKAPQAPNTSTIENNNNAYANATKSPQRTTTMQPQNHKNIPPPPSPSNLKAKTEVEPKIDAESDRKTLLGNDEKQVITKENETKEKIRAITLAGENRGAYMEIIQSSKKPNLLHKKGNSKIKVYDYESENFASGEGNANGKKNKSHRTLLYSPPIGAYINSNVQSANNSLLYCTTCKSNDPGVQITLSRKQSSEGEEGFHHLKEHVEGKQNN